MLLQVLDQIGGQRGLAGAVAAHHGNQPANAGGRGVLFGSEFIFFICFGTKRLFVG